MQDLPIIHAIDDLSASWLSRALGAPVRRFTAAAVGTGQLSDTYRIALDWEGPFASVVLKLAGEQPMVRATGLEMGLYAREVSFYNELAPRLPAAALATCHAAAYDATAGSLTLLMEDVAPATAGDQIAGCDPVRARQVVIELARMQAAVMEDDALAASLARPHPVNSRTLALMLPVYDERFGPRIDPAHRGLLDRFVAYFDSWAAWAGVPHSIEHGDFRLDNMLFREPSGLAVVDWATVKWGPVTNDLAFFVGGSLTTADRRAHERGIVKAYRDALGARGLSADDCWRGYVLGAFTGVLMAIAAPMVAERTARGDDLFMTMLERHCQQVLDNDGLALLEEVHRTAITVDPADEARHRIGVGHATGRDETWNESWYLDGIDASGALGVYVRLGLVPHQDHALFSAYVVREGHPSVAIVDGRAPLPAAGLAVSNTAFRSELTIEEPLQRIRWALTGNGEAHPDPAAALRGERGSAVPVKIELTWVTEGTPYMYTLATRYEMPCRVTGTVTIGEDALAFDGPGQRDHSWGPRDWWSFDWTWASAHLDDGTRIQGIELRYPGLAPAGAGYEQRDGSIAELTALDAAYAVPSSRLPGRTDLSLSPTGTRLRYEPVAYGPLRLTADDGRICEFPRAMARVSTVDGRDGVGWIEWGHNVAGHVPRRRGRAVAAGRRGLDQALARIPDRALEATMASPIGRRLTAALMRALPGHLNARIATGITACLRFRVYDPHSRTVDTYELELVPDRPPAIRAAAGTGTPTVTLTLTGPDLFALAIGRLDAVQAALTGRISLNGDLDFMPTFAGLLSADATTPTGHPSTVGRSA